MERQLFYKMYSCTSSIFTRLNDMSGQESQQTRNCISSRDSSSTTLCEAMPTPHQCCCKEDNLKHCRFTCSNDRENRFSPQLQGQKLTLLHTRSIQTLSRNTRNFHLRNFTMYRRHSYPKTLSLFGRVLLSFVFLLSVCTLSFAHKTVPWEFSSIEDATSNDQNLHRGYTLKIPDIVAVSGHLFQYQIQNEAFGTRTVHYLAREAGRNKLPNWLSFNQTSATFRGVPLLQDQARVYISLDVFVTEQGVSAPITESLFSINVVASKLQQQTSKQHKLWEEASRHHELLSEDELVLAEDYEDGKCPLNYHLSLGDVPSYPYCSDGRLPVIASMVTFLNLRQLSGFKRADLFLTISQTIGICSNTLLVNSVDWTSKEGITLWRELAETGNIDYLDSATILSFQLSCGAIDYNNESVVSRLTYLDQYLTTQSEMTPKEDAEKDTPLVFLYLRWFVSRGSQVLLTSSSAPEEVHQRLRRLTIDAAMEDPIIEGVYTTTIPELISSSAATYTSTTSFSSMSSSTAVRATTVSSSSTTHSSVSTAEFSTMHSVARSSVSSTTLSVAGSSTPVHTTSSLDPKSTPSTTPSRSAQTTATTERLIHGTSSDISLGPSMSNIPSLSQQILPSSRVIPGQMTRADSVVLDSPTQMLQTSGSILPSSHLIAPSSRVIPSSEPTLVLEPSSLALSTSTQTQSLSPASSESIHGLSLPETSIPLLSVMFSVNSLLTSLPMLTESALPTSSRLPSRSFSIRSSIEDLLSPTPTFSLPPSSSLLTQPTSTLPPISQSSSGLLIPDMTTSILSPFTTSVRISSSLLSLPPTFLVTPESTADILLPETTSTLIFPSPTISIRPATSDIVLELTSLITVTDISTDILMPESSDIFATTLVLPESSSAILLPDSSSSFLIEPTPTLSSEFLLLSTSMILMPDPTMLSSLVVQTSSNNMLMPMSSSELTLSISIFTPSFSSRLTMSPVDASPVTVSVADTVTTAISITPSVTDMFAATSSVAILTPSTFTVPSIFVSSPSPSLSDVMFPETSIFIPDSTSVIVLPSLSIPTPTVVRSSLLMPMPTSEITVSLSTFTPSPSRSIPMQISSSEFTFPQTTDEVSFTMSPMSFLPMSSMAVSSLLLPMSTSDITASLSIFTPSPSRSILETPVETSKMVVILPTETMVILPESTDVFSIMPTASPIRTDTFSTPLFTPPLSSFQFVDSSRTITVDIFPTTQIAFSETLVTLFMTSSSMTSPLMTSPSITSPSMTKLPSSSMTLSLTPSLSPTPSPSLSFCEENGIFCGNGTCVNDTAIVLMNFTFCNCYPDFTGKFCDDIIDDCHFSPCFVNGTKECVDGNSSFTCNCNAGYTGDLCNEEIDGCLSAPCQFGATCLNLGLGMFICMCPAGYSGQFCENDINPCDPNPCQLNETCMMVNSQNFTCDVFASSSLVQVSATTISTALSSISESSFPSSFAVSTSQTLRSFPSSELSPSVTLLTSTTLISTAITTTQASSSVFTLTIILPSSSQRLTTTITPTPHTTPVTPSLTPTATSMPPVNLIPVLLNPIGTLIVNVGQIFQFPIPENTYFDPESGTTSSLILTLLNFRGESLPNTTWIQVQQGHLEGLPLSSEVANDAITDHVFILQAQDEMGSSIHDFVTIRVLPLGPFSSFLTVLFENAFDELNQNLTQKIILVERLSSASIPSSSSLRKRQLQLPEQMYNTEKIFVREIFDSSPLAVTYKNLTIADLNCAEFHDWVENIYNFTTDEYTQRFVEVMAPEFLPTPTPRIEGTCNAVSSNIAPTLGGEVEIDSTLSERVILLSTLVPAACIALCCLLMGLCALLMYRRTRSERKYLTSKRLYLNRRPIILEGEVDLPDRRRRPVIFENEIALRGNIVLEEEEEDRHSDTSSDELVPPAGDRDRLLRDPNVPPHYRLPPLYTREQFQDHLYDR